MLFNGKYYNKPGHLGLTRQQLKEALEGGGGGVKNIDVELNAEQIAAIQNQQSFTIDGEWLVSDFMDALITGGNLYLHGSITVGDVIVTLGQNLKIVTYIKGPDNITFAGDSFVTNDTQISFSTSLDSIDPTKIDSISCGFTTFATA